MSYLKCLHFKLIVQINFLNVRVCVCVFQKSQSFFSGRRFLVIRKLITNFVTYSAINIVQTRKLPIRIGNNCKNRYLSIRLQYVQYIMCKILYYYTIIDNSSELELYIMYIITNGKHAVVLHTHIIWLTCILTSYIAQQQQRQ